MKHTKIRHISGGITSLLLAIICISMMGLHGFSIRYLIGALLAMAACIFELRYAFDKQSIEEQLEKECDERNQLILMKTSRQTIQWIQWIVSGGAMISLVCYGITKIDIFMIIGMTLCVLLMILFLSFLYFNLYYEKRL